MFNSSDVDIASAISFLQTVTLSRMHVTLDFFVIEERREYNYSTRVDSLLAGQCDDEIMTRHVISEDTLAFKDALMHPSLSFEKDSKLEQAAIVPISPLD